MITAIFCTLEQIKDYTQCRPGNKSVRLKGIRVRKTGFNWLINIFPHNSMCACKSRGRWMYAFIFKCQLTDVSLPRNLIIQLTSQLSLFTVLYDLSNWKMFEGLVFIESRLIGVLVGGVHTTVSERAALIVKDLLFSCQSLLPKLSLLFLYLVESFSFVYLSSVYSNKMRIKEEHSISQTCQV